MTNDLFRSFNFSLLFLCVCFLLPQIWGKNQWGNRIEMILFILQAQILKMKKMGSEWVYDDYCLFLFYMCFIASYAQWFSCYNRIDLLFLVCEHGRCIMMQRNKLWEQTHWLFRNILYFDSNQYKSINLLACHLMIVK